ncbi:unnamed protein product [Leptosia nina]|uniref:Lipid-binding serum glycoprotein N-terminal domain-containing protein n=1 Tax=Leptosia nina TaxID=320188 RepID=A0AAV1JP15_9NEOP
MFHEIFLGELPHLVEPEVTFALASNVLQIDSKLDKMFLHTRYSLFRNHTDIVFGGKVDKHSPFTFDSVEITGNLAIIADDCKLSGSVLTKLSGQSVDIGHSNFMVSNCKFTVEISSVGYGREPVIAPYFTKQKSKALEKLISKPIREELLPKLQATLLTYVNTTLIFHDRLSEYRQHQRRIFKDTSKHVMKIIKNLAVGLIQLSQGPMKLKPFDVSSDICVERPCPIGAAVHDVNVFGLDTVYSGHMGGPFKLQSLKIHEDIRFNYILVRGKISFKNTTFNREHGFSIELGDVTFNTEIDISKNVQNCEFVSWRSIEIAIFGFINNVEERMNANSFLSAYLYNELPKTLTKHLLKAFGNNFYKLAHKSDDENANNDAETSSKEINEEQNQSVSDVNIDEGNGVNVKFDKAEEIKKLGIGDRGKGSKKSKFSKIGYGKLSHKFNEKFTDVNSSSSSSSDETGDEKESDNLSNKKETSLIKSDKIKKSTKKKRFDKVVDKSKLINIMPYSSASGNIEDKHDESDNANTGKFSMNLSMKKPKNNENFKFEEFKETKNKALKKKKLNNTMGKGKKENRGNSDDDDSLSVDQARVPDRSQSINFEKIPMKLKKKPVYGGIITVNGGNSNVKFPKSGEIKGHKDETSKKKKLPKLGQISENDSKNYDYDKSINHRYVSDESSVAYNRAKSPMKRQGKVQNKNMDAKKKGKIRIGQLNKHNHHANDRLSVADNKERITHLM